MAERLFALAPGKDRDLTRRSEISKRAAPGLGPQRCMRTEAAPHVAMAPLGRLSGGFGEGVVEVVRMLAVDDVDGHFTGETGQLAGAGIRHDRDGLLRCTPRQSATVLEHEAAGAALQHSGDALDGDVACRAFDIRAGGEHLALAGRFEIAVELFVDGHLSEG